MSDFVPRIVPSPDGLTAEFYAHLAGGELRLQRCDDCERWRHPPRILCAACGSARWPYAVAVVELAEGPRLVTAVCVAPDALRIGLPVEVRIAPASDTIGLHYFVPRA